MTALLLLALLLPLLLALLAGVRGAFGRVILALEPWAALPALATALIAPAGLRIDLPWLFLGARLELDLVGRGFLLLAALLWTAAGWYARAYLGQGENRTRFRIFFLLALSGNLGLTIAQDLATFYLFFTLMTFAAYGLVVHERSTRALRAGKVYMVLAVLGEGLLLGGALMAAAGAPSLLGGDIAGAIASSASPDLSLAMLFLGFGVKAGVVPMHVWLPLAHPVAPTAASAVLSGTMIKAGVLGWIRFLPIGEASLPGWGALLVALGITSALYGVVFGLPQRDPKTILAYSSISQIGIMTAALGVGMDGAGAATGAVGAITIYALHHGLAKGALFLGVGLAGSPVAPARAAMLVGMALAAFSIAGAPLTGGAVAKQGVHEVAHRATSDAAHLLEIVLPFTAVATTLLMARLFQRLITASPAQGGHHSRAGLWLPWLALLAAAAGAGSALRANPRFAELQSEALTAPPFFESAGPIVAGIVIFLVGLQIVCAVAPRRGELAVPPGDLLAVLAPPLRALRQRAGAWRVRAVADPVDWVAENWYAVYADREKWAGLLVAERRLCRWSTAGLIFLLVAFLLWGTLVVGS